MNDDRSPSTDRRFRSFSIEKRPFRRVIPGLVYLVCCLAVAAHLSAPAHAQTHPSAASPLSQKKILILHAHEANVPVFVETDAGLSATLESGGISGLNQFFETLDLRRNPLPEDRKLLVEVMRLRYSHRKFDMIITMFPEALEFVLNDCVDILPHVPILALYLPENFTLPKADRPIVGHSARTDITGTFEVALKLVPRAKHVYVVAGVHELDRRMEDRARRELKKWEGRLEFHYLSSMPFEDMAATISAAPPDSLVLALVVSHDMAGTLYTSVKVAQRLSQVSGAPVFGLLKAALGQGIAGGSLIDFERIGNGAGRLALNILRGAEAPGNTPAVPDVPPVPMFDWRQLKHWKLDVDALPKGSIVVNRQFTLWDWRYYLIGTAVFCSVESVLVLVLIIQRRRAKAHERALQENERMLRQNRNDLRELTGRLISAHEEEKSYLARELHDDLTQRLAVLSMNAERLEQRFRNSAEPAQRFRNSAEPAREEIHDLKNELIRLSLDVHNLARRLHPSILDDLGLVRAIESECAAFLEREGVSINFEHENVSNIIEKDIALSLYRIVQEGLRNISKHACAGHVSVSLYGSDQDMLLSIQDDGIGFDLAESKAAAGIGLLSLRERARLINSELSVSSQPGGGTVITIRVPSGLEG